jgi:hypothetical protein
MTLLEFDAWVRRKQRSLRWRRPPELYQVINALWEQVRLCAWQGQTRKGYLGPNRQVGTGGGE